MLFIISENKDSRRPGDEGRCSWLPLSSPGIWVQKKMMGWGVLIDDASCWVTFCELKIRRGGVQCSKIALWFKHSLCNPDVSSKW